MNVQLSLFAYFIVQFVTFCSFNFSLAFLQRTRVLLFDRDLILSYFTSVPMKKICQGRVSILLYHLAERYTVCKNTFEICLEKTGANFVELLTRTFSSADFIGYQPNFYAD